MTEHCVLIDTNVYRSTLLLRAGLGPALLHIICRGGARLGMPEVIADEIRKQLLIAGETAVASVERGFREILAIMGQHRPYTVPPSANIVAAIEARLNELESLFESVPLTLEHARSALRRVNEGSPPNGPKNQQFKDSLIWEAALNLAERFHVHLVTMDTGFFADKNLSAPAPELLRETEALGRTISIYSKLQDCLEVLRRDATEIDLDRVAAAIQSAIRRDLDVSAGRRGVRMAQLIENELTPFITEYHDVIALGFRLMFEGVNLSTEQREDIKISVEGEGRYSYTADLMIDVKLHRIIYEWMDEGGEHRSSTDAYGYIGTAYSGEGPDLYHTIREPLT
ncbi:MAG: PIN domain-containing protein [Nitrospirota bacterium]